MNSKIIETANVINKIKHSCNYVLNELYGCCEWYNRSRDC